MGGRFFDDSVGRIGICLDRVAGISERELNNVFMLCISVFGEVASYHIFGTYSLSPSLSLSHIKCGAPSSYPSSYSPVVFQSSPHIPSNFYFSTPLFLLFLFSPSALTLPASLRPVLPAALFPKGGR